MLRSLRLVGVRLVVEFVDVMRANAGTLKHVHLEAVGVTLGLMQHLCLVKGFVALETFRVVEDYPGHLFMEDKLLERIKEEPAADAEPVPRLMYDDIRKWPKNFFRIVSTDTAFDDKEMDDAPSCTLCVREHTPNHIMEKGDACLNPDHDTSLAKDVGEAPCWRWKWFLPPGQEDSEPMVYYYSVPVSELLNNLSFSSPTKQTDNRLGHPTEIHRFVSRDGTVAYGRDPLNWFDDWDTEDGRDVSEPTPFCHSLLKFVKLGPPKLKSKTARAAAKAGVLRELPDGAVAYDRDGDPLVNVELAYEEGE
jgi:hypothetical protein